MDPTGGETVLSNSGPTNGLTSVYVDERSSNPSQEASNLVEIPPSFPSRDPLGLETAPTYTYSFKNGLHNFVLPATTSTDTKPVINEPFVVSGITFDLAPLVSAGDCNRRREFAIISTTPSSKKFKKGCWQTKEMTKLSKMSRVKMEEEALLLPCEWDQCTDTYEDLTQFMDHVRDHVSDIPILDTAENTFGCLWRDCGHEANSSSEMVRHLHFHTFHTKIKSHGASMIRETGVDTCQLDSQQRNVLPSLSVSDFSCQWQGCDNCDNEEAFCEPLKYYWHVQWHPEEYRGQASFSNQGSSKGYKCRWRGCGFHAKTVSKLRDHVKSHSAERGVGCPVCGGLFSNRVKFYDHCIRQLDKQRQSSYKCSYCQKCFNLERLLRDHMRSHINHYKCPMCEMTCPTPSSLNRHISYRHNDNKGFSCPYEDECPFRTKTQADINRHLRRVHFGENLYKCTREGCDAKFKSKCSLKHHEDSQHLMVEPKYCCHMCTKRFKRGNYLTKHLIAVHGYKWPVGHSRFQYKMDHNGMYHVQTIRFESSDLAPALPVERLERVQEEEEDEPMCIVGDTGADS